MVILAHRAYRNGADPARENRLPAFVECLQQGWGAEIDVRRNSCGGFYISHDVAPDGDRPDAGPFFQAIHQHASAPIALNVKELGYEAQLIRVLDSHGVVDRVFLFDMELIEPERGVTASLFRTLHPTIQIAARVSDRSEPIEAALANRVADVIWVDEFDRLWITEADVEGLKATGRTVYAISPEIHGFPLAATIERWRQFAAWGIDGICTDVPDQARSHLKAMRAERAL
jgi:glycerophosphoryl diester phosphodiesterase